MNFSNLNNTTHTNGSTRDYSNFFTSGFRLGSRGGNRRFATVQTQTQTRPRLQPQRRNQGGNGNEWDLNKGSTPNSSLTFDSSSMSSLDLTSGSQSKPKPKPKPKQRPTSMIISFPRTNSYSSQNQSQSRDSKSNSNTQNQNQNQDQNQSQNQKNRRLSIASISSRFKTKTTNNMFNFSCQPSTPTPVSSFDITMDNDNDMESQHSRGESDSGSPADSESWEFWDMSMTPDVERRRSSWCWSGTSSTGGTDIDPFSASPSSKSFFVDFPDTKCTAITSSDCSETGTGRRRNSISFWPFSSAFPLPPKTHTNINTNNINNATSTSNKQQKRNSFLRNIKINTPHPDSSFLHISRPRPHLGRDEQSQGNSYEGVTGTKTRTGNLTTTQVQANPVNVYASTGVSSVNGCGGGNGDDCRIYRKIRKPNLNSNPSPTLKRKPRPVTICGSLPLAIPLLPPLSKSSTPTASNYNVTRIIRDIDGITTDTARRKNTRSSISIATSSSSLPPSSSSSSSMIYIENELKEGDEDSSESIKESGDLNTVSITTNVNPGNTVTASRNVVTDDIGGIDSESESRSQMRMRTMSTNNSIQSGWSSISETRTRSRKVVQSGSGLGALKLKLDFDLLDGEEAPVSARNSWNPNDNVDDVPAWMDWRLFHYELLGACD